VIEPIQLTFELRCSADHAFEVWTQRIGQWWPVDHTASGEDGLTVVLEGQIGGRIFERTVAGVELDWGEVTVWEPPTRLGYLWHLRQDRAKPTRVEIRFVPVADDRTRVEIEHRDWERLGEAGPDLRERNRGGWATLLPHFVDAASAG
jgi:hypothetical protein